MVKSTTIRMIMHIRLFLIIIIFTCISCHQMHVTSPQAGSNNIPAHQTDCPTCLTVGLVSATLPAKSETQKFDLSDGSNIIASSDCKLVINEMERQVIMKQPGDLYVKVEENKGKPLRIITPAGNIIARGTEFSIRVDEGEKNNQLNKGIFSVLVYVINGTIELTTPMGNVFGDSSSYRVLYAEDGSAPVRNYCW